MSFRDWQEPREDYEHTLGGLRTGSEVLADLEAERDLDRERFGEQCPNCGAYVLANPCRLCGGGMEQAA